MTNRDSLWVVDVVAALQALVSDPERVSADQHVTRAHAEDISYHAPRTPEAVVFPDSRAEVQAILRWANRERVPVTPYGSGTSVEGHVIPVQGGISLDLSRMREIAEVRPGDLLARVQAGVTRLQLEERLREAALFFPVDPGADATVGGMVATNASGTNAVRYGTMRQNTLGLEVVLANGTVVRTGGAAPKSSAGYDLTRLFVGSEGTLGVVTEVLLRVQALPEFVVAGRAVFPSLDAAVRAARRLIQTGTAVARVELVDELTVRAVNTFEGTDYSEGPTLFLELSGAEAAVRHELERAEREARAEGCIAFDAGSDEAKRARLWQARHNAALAVIATAPGKKLMSTDVCVPISALPDAIRHARQLAESAGVEAAILGHVGDGNYHTIFMVDPADEEEVARAERINAEIVRHALAADGTCTGEHGIGLGKRGYLREERGAAVDLMLAIKRTLDPNGILNPGKVVE
jgi:D-lactate dehydrogenase (cytochrome)